MSIYCSCVVAVFLCTFVSRAGSYVVSTPTNAFFAALTHKFGDCCTCFSSSVALTKSLFKSGKKLLLYDTDKHNYYCTLGVLGVAVYR